MGARPPKGQVVLTTFRPRQFIRNWVLAFVAPKPIVGVFYLPRFVAHWFRFRQLGDEMPAGLGDTYPCLTDWSAETQFDAHYFYQGAWLARKIAEARPSRHVDVGSSVMTVGVLTAFVDTLFIDFRPLRAKMPGLQSVAGTITSLPFVDNSVESLSCLHVIEHVGLGRYGDPIDPRGSHKAANELQRALMPGGSLYLSAPVGRERVCFNAHRVFAPRTLQSLFPQLETAGFSLVNDQGDFIENATLAEAECLDYGCGMFEFKKPVAQKSAHSAVREPRA